MQSIENKILARIYGRGRGWAFTRVDFVADFGDDNIHKALASLAQKGYIRRVLRGVYDYPGVSELVSGNLSPDIDQVARAIARKFNWRIQPGEATALNILGLSTQLPGRWIYLSDGPSRTYSIGVQELAFKKASLKLSGFKHRESGLLVQAIKGLGKGSIEKSHLTKLRKSFDQRTGEKILRDTRTAPGWVHEIIKSIFKEGLA